MSVEVTAAHAEFLGERWTFLDCPGSVELSQDTRNALMVADVAIVVCEPQTEQGADAGAAASSSSTTTRFRTCSSSTRWTSPACACATCWRRCRRSPSRPLVLRQVPIREAGKNGDAVTGYVDLVSERAYRYKPGQPSDLIQMPEDMLPREQEARAAAAGDRWPISTTSCSSSCSRTRCPRKEEIYQQLTQGPAPTT